MADNPASPNMVPLDNGVDFVPVPDGMDPKNLPAFVGEQSNVAAQDYMKQAQTQDAPVTVGNKIYSATSVYPNTYLGVAGAWVDHHGGNALKNALPAPSDAAREVDDSVNRILTNRFIGALDLPASGLNVMKHYFEPERGVSGDIPYISSSILHEIGSDQLPADASTGRRLTEAILTGATPANIKQLPGLWQTIKNAGTAGLSSELSEWGGKLFGEPGAFIAGLIPAVPWRQGTAAVVAHGVREESPGPPDPTTGRPRSQAEATSDAFYGARPTGPNESYQPLGVQRDPSTPDFSQATPSFTSLANETGQRFANTLSGIPWGGDPILKANQNLSDFIRYGRDEASRAVSPLVGPPGTTSDATLGTTLTQGAQRAVIAILNDLQQRQETQNRLMSAPGDEPGTARVPLTDTVMTALQAVAGGKRGTPETEAARAVANDIIEQSPGGSRYEGPDVPLPAQPNMTWSAITDLVGHLTDTLAQSGKTALPGDIADNIKKAANAEREAAANAQSPNAGATFRANNEIYARAQEALDKLRKFAGEEIGRDGRFANVPKEQAAAQILKSSLQSPESYGQTLTHPMYPQDARLHAAAQIISQLGESTTGGTSSGFRPETFANQTAEGGRATQRPGLDELMTSRSGQPHTAQALLDALNQVAARFTTPTSRFGLIKSLGTAEAVRKALEYADKFTESLAGMKIPVVAPATARVMSNVLENEATKNAMANRPQDYTAPLNRLQVSGAITNAEQRRRMGWSPANQPGALP
jgi:hypothetical protein